MIQMARKTSSAKANNEGRVLSNLAATGVAAAWFEARLASSKHEAAGTWDTKEGIAAEKTAGYLAMALEAAGMNLNDLEPAYNAYCTEQANR